jgi:galactokinase
MNQSIEIVAAIAAGAHDLRFNEIYVDSSLLQMQKERYIRSIERYHEIFGAGEAAIYSAPGRSEVGGNHTDHQHGSVLAASVNLDAIAITAPRADQKVVLMSEGYQMMEVNLNELSSREKERESASGLIRGMAYGIQTHGYKIGGFQAYITSDVLGGAGLSSSAAFEVLIGTIFSGLYNENQISPIEIAQMAQYAENVYFGKPCGLMDQMACSVGGLIHIDFKDNKNPLVEQVNVNFATFGHSLCITDTRGSHADLTDEYAAVPQEMQVVARYFGKEFLREVDENEFFQNITALRDKMGDRNILRALHFFQEQVRVEAQVKALTEGRFSEFLALIKQSGASSFEYLQNVYTTQDVEKQAVSIGLAVSEVVLGDCGVSRVHGGGFAGTIQAFVQNEFVEQYRSKMDQVFGEGACHILKVRPVGGVRVL